MSESSQPQTPFHDLGSHLRYLREQLKQSLAEVSGAVEIDEAVLARIEEGNERPPEDILLLLISHFNMQDQEAVQLWELAGYDGDMPEQLRVESEAAANKPVMVLLAIDARTMYSDGIEVAVDKSGLVLHFTQSNGQKQQMPVARVGMSREQAQAVVVALQKGLLKAEYLSHPKRLPPSSSSSGTVN